MSVRNVTGYVCNVWQREAKTKQNKIKKMSIGKLKGKMQNFSSEGSVRSHCNRHVCSHAVSMYVHINKKTISFGSAQRQPSEVNGGWVA